MAIKAAARRKIPKTRYPNSAERFYVRQLVNLVNQLGKVLLQVFDEQIKPQIKQYKARQDTTEYKQDAPLDVIRQAIEIIKGLSLGIFSSGDVQRIAERFVKSVNQQSKANAQAQGKTHNVDPTQYEPWLSEFMRSSIAENVSYISTIRDEFFPKIESIIYQGVKKGQSLGDIRRGLVDRIGMTRNRAQFIAVDQTGTIFGQMTAKRHQEMGVSKFEWVDSGDNRVRPLHRHYNGNIYEYTHPPADGLPGEPFRCRCVAYPVFDDEQPVAILQQPAFLRINADEDRDFDDIKAIHHDMDMIPEAHRNLLSEAVKEIKIIDDPPSFFRRKTGVVYIAKGLEKGELVHELGHVIETHLDFNNNPKYKKLIQTVVAGKTIADVYLSQDYIDPRTNEPAALLKSDKFISDYQGYLYDVDGNGFLDNSGNINPKSLGEYFSEAYREYVANPQNLRKRDRQLYDLIKGLI